MKSYFTLILFFCAFVGNIQAQDITVDPVNFIENHTDLDLSIATHDLESYISVKNNTSETIQLVWTRNVTENCPVEWQTQICDNNLCYYFTVDSNLEATPFELGPDEEFTGFVLHAFPNSVPGCCRVKVDFSHLADPETIIETAIFDISVNTAECDFSSSTQEIAEAQLVSVFPNPTNDGFTLSNNDVISQIDLYNSLGQKLNSFEFVNGEYYNVADLQSGIYSLVLKNKKGEVLNTVTLDKI